MLAKKLNTTFLVVNEKSIVSKFKLDDDLNYDYDLSDRTKVFFYYIFKKTDNYCTVSETLISILKMMQYYYSRNIARENVQEL